MNRELLMLVEAISGEKNGERDPVFGAVESALAQATKKLYQGEVDIRVAIDRDSGNYDTFRRWLVVPDDAGLQNPDAEEMLMDAQDRVPGISEGEYIEEEDRKSTRLNSSHSQISYAVFCLKKKKKLTQNTKQTR